MTKGAGVGPAFAATLRMNCGGHYRIPAPSANSGRFAGAAGLRPEPMKKGPGSLPGLHDVDRGSGPYSAGCSSRAGASPFSALSCLISWPVS